MSKCEQLKKTEITDCVIVVPTHKSKCSDSELKSLKNTLKVFNERRVFILLPHDVSGEYYQELQQTYENLFILNLRKGWLGSFDNYNSMMLNEDFYNLFKDYKFMLICHLDAWVFRDELNYWMSQKYDCIGAPLFLPEDTSVHDVSKLAAPIGVNGGLCLRNIESICSILDGEKIKLKYTLFFNWLFFLLSHKQYGLLKIYVTCCLSVFRYGWVSFQKKFAVNEDVLISIIFPMIYRGFKVAPPRVASKFSLEVNATEIINTRSDLKLPFGIHGIDKYIDHSVLARYIEKNYLITKIKKQETITIAVRPLVTIVTITKNIIEAGRKEMLEQCIKSVANQTYSNIEHLIIDGDSSDGTLNLLSKYGDSLRVISSRDKGVWDAMHKSIEKTRGEYINFLNSDDYFCNNDAISIAVEKMTTSSARWFYSEAKILSQNGLLSDFPSSTFGVFGCMGIVHQTVFIEKELLVMADPFTAPCMSKENYMMMLLLINKFNVAYSTEALVHYREGGFSFYEYGSECQVKAEIFKKDFAKYFYDLVGFRNGLTEKECYDIIGFPHKKMPYQTLRKMRFIPFTYRAGLFFKYRGLRQILKGCINGLKRS